VVDTLAVDVAVTWAGAVGCIYYLYHSYMVDGSGSGTGQTRLLVAVMAALLGIRGFAWLSDSNLLESLTFAVASWLPLVITLFIERVLRRHHPLWLKIFALGTTVVFFLANPFVLMPGNHPWQFTFAICLAAVVLANAICLLARRRASLSLAENRLASALLLVAALSVPLVVSDFRYLWGHFPVRLGAIAALLFVYVVLGSAARSLGIVGWTLRMTGMLVVATGLSALFALAMQGAHAKLDEIATLQGLPVAYAWLLLSAIFVNSRAISAGGGSNAFLRWLAHAPQDSVAAFRDALADLPDTATHVLLDASDLGNYTPSTLRRLADIADGPVSRHFARNHATAADSSLAEAAEQWLELLERHEMSHAIAVNWNEPRLILFNLPATTSVAVAELRLAIIQRLAQRIDRESA
jgi:hypothetical protein